MHALFFMLGLQIISTNDQGNGMIYMIYIRSAWDMNSDFVLSDQALYLHIIDVSLLSQEHSLQQRSLVLVHYLPGRGEQEVAPVGVGKLLWPRAA